VTAYTIVGGGAIGGTLAFHLTEAGHEIVVVDNDIDHVEAIRSNGLTLRGSDLPDRVARMRAVTPAELGSIGRLDKVLLAVKSQATSSAVDMIAPRLSDAGYVASVQNGLNERAIAARVGTEHTIAAFVNLAADVIKPGVIGAGGPGALVFGELDGSPSARIDELVADLAAWGPARASANVEGFLWSKMGYGAMLVATSLADAPMAELIDRHRGLMHCLVREVFAVAAAEGVVLERFDGFDPSGYSADAEVSEANEATDRLVAFMHTLAKKRSGIWRDVVVRRRPTEVPDQFAPVLQLAKEHQVPTPTVCGLLESLRRLEADEVQMGEELLYELELQ
jgi:2-dehydropantoate 2-reductase